MSSPYAIALRLSKKVKGMAMGAEKDQVYKEGASATVHVLLELFKTVAASKEQDPVI